MHNIMRSIFLLLILGSAAAIPKGPQRIVGGSPTEITQYPYMANLQYLWWGVAWTQWCGGTLITTRTVLSSASCFSGVPTPIEWSVRLGSTYANSGGSIHEVEKLVLHERFDEPQADNDLSIVWLATPAVLSDSVQVARVAGANYILPDHTSVTVIGWGSVFRQRLQKRNSINLDSPPAGRNAEYLHHVDVNIINQVICVGRYRYLKYEEPGFDDWPEVTSGMICTGIFNQGGKDACEGDSGGPVIFTGDFGGHVVVGVTSWGYDCGHEFYPAVNTRVSKHVDWIVANGSV